MSIAEKLTTIAENEPKIFEKGKQSEYDRFWDAYQENGDKRFYGYAFAYWNDEVFKPKYTIITDANANRTNFMFGYAKVTEIMTPLYFYEKGACNSSFYNLSNCTKIGYETGGGIWVTRDRLYTSNFANCKKLEEVRFIDYNEKGEYVPSEIGQSIDFSYSPLSVASMKNIIQHLVNYKDTENDGKNSVKFTEDCWTALEADSSAPDGGTWEAYVLGLGWTK